MNENEDVLHWYDFVCPFCYVGQTRTAILTRYGLSVIELPFQAHPNIPPSGVAASPRTWRDVWDFGTRGQRSWIDVTLATPAFQYSPGSRGCRVGQAASGGQVRAVPARSVFGTFCSG